AQKVGCGWWPRNASLTAFRECRRGYVATDRFRQHSFDTSEPQTDHTEPSQPAARRSEARSLRTCPGKTSAAAGNRWSGQVTRVWGCASWLGGEIGGARRPLPSDRLLRICLEMCDFQATWGGWWDAQAAGRPAGEFMGRGAAGEVARVAGGPRQDRRAAAPGG